MHRPIAPLLILVSIACLLTACGRASGSSAAATPATSVQVTLVDFMIHPDTLTASAGDVTFAVKHDGKTPHNFTILDASGSVIAHTPNLNPGQSTTLSTRLAAGTYTYICSLAGHRSLGMQGTLTVS